MARIPRPSAPLDQGASDWDRTAAAFESRVFSVWERDRAGVLARIIDLHARPDGLAADFGCGTGRGLARLATAFGSVVGMDFSPACVALAQRRARKLPNVEVMQGDVMQAPTLVSGVDFAVAVNVLLHARAASRRAMLAGMCRALRPGARLLLVVPALESMLYALGVEHASGRRWTGGLALLRPREGIVRVGGVPTKSFLRVELERLAQQVRMQAEAVVRIEYTWRAEYPRAPAGLGRPGPWDWAALLRR